ncbi:cell wall-active antibiotics response protein LiaF [Lentibacillus saliphilus]|uniref:cell wall-active antibiotics response protein LiaF n=1 Tax=Lentibacillus saliphilus TaxID=2737028 RepID=UPI001C2FF360|nr:cell wall-active antibiotics response protein LiaF [Lentibacillus saliphilus]
MRGRFLSNLIAVTLIAFGVLLILANVNVIDFDFGTIWHYLYPILFVAIGFKWLMDSLRRKGGSLLFGSLFLVLGILLLLDRFQVITFTFSDIMKLWPLLIIYIGLTMIGFPKKRGIRVVVSKDDEDTVQKTSRFSIGDKTFNEENWTLTPIDFRDAVGDYYMNLSKAYIPEKEIPIHINNWAGEIHLLIPENVACRIDASVKAGELVLFGQTADGINRTLHHESEDYKTATRKLDIHLRMKAGSIRVDRV